MPQSSRLLLKKRTSTVTALLALTALVIVFSSGGAERLVVEYTLDYPEIHKVSLGDKMYD